MKISTNDRSRDFAGRAAEAAIAGLDAGVGGSDAHLDENLLAGYAEGRLLERELELAEAHLARCEECREMVVMLGGEYARSSAASPTEGGAGAPAPILRFRLRRPLLIAAGLVAVVGLGLIGRKLLGPAADFSTRLRSSVNELASLEPELFGEILPADPSRKRSDDPSSSGTGGPILRGEGPRPLLPRGTTIARRPEFVWENATGPVTLTLLDLEGRVLFQVEGATSPLAYPPDAESPSGGGTYLWKLSWGPEGAEQDALASFTAASEQQRQGFQRATMAIDRQPPEAPRDLLLAAYALHHDHLAEAERAARRALAADPEEELAHKLLRIVLGRIGSAE